MAALVSVGALHDCFGKVDMFIGCPHDGKVLKHFEGRYTAVWIVLFPFLRPRTIPLDRFYPETYPTRNEILADCDPVSWAEVVESSDFESLSEVDVALRSYCGGIRAPNERLLDILEGAMENLRLIPPAEGDIAPHTEQVFLTRMRALGHDCLLVSDEFGQRTDKVRIADLMDNDRLPAHGVLASQDWSVLLSTHWDSFNSFLCVRDGSVQFPDLEKLTCTVNTEVYWGLCPL